MKVLIACEESQTVCKAFRANGHEAYSADILPCSGGHPEWHLQGDVIPLLNQGWDLIIAHPPCTDLSSSGARWFKDKRADGRQQRSIDFFMKFVGVDCPRVAIENPVGIMSTRYRKPDQIIQPWQFGHTETKATCLWLKGLRPLVPTNNVKEEMDKLPDKLKHRIHYTSSKNRGVIRSKTFQGVADAMAKQWGKCTRVHNENQSATDSRRLASKHDGPHRRRPDCCTKRIQTGSGAIPQHRNC